MATLNNLLYHLVFSTQNREPFIVPGIGNDLHKYLGGIINAIGGTALQVGGTEDHIHMLVKLRPTSCLADVMMHVKGGSSRWINEQKRLAHLFAWQKGYGAFSVGHSQAGAVVRYIKGQAAHHRQFSYRDELLQLLEDHDVQYDEKYLWE